jgi:hypothetical protein
MMKKVIGTLLQDRRAKLLHVPIYVPCVDENFGRSRSRVGAQTTASNHSATQLSTGPVIMDLYGKLTMHTPSLESSMLPGDQFHPSQANLRGSSKEKTGGDERG